MTNDEAEKLAREYHATMNVYEAQVSDTLLLLAAILFGLCDLIAWAAWWYSP